MRLAFIHGAKKKRNGNAVRCRRRLHLEALEDRRLLANVPEGFTETVVASDLTSPITMDIEESGRIWVAYQDGRIEVIQDDQLLPYSFQLDADGSGERGLQGIELDPDFESNGFIYVYYTAASPESHNRLSRLTVDPLTENTIIPGSEEILLELPLFSTLPQNTAPIWHMGGAIHFLADETIVVQVGDHLNNSIVQSLDSPLGKVLRVNKDGTPAADNPYYDAGDGIGWRDYVWASGLRNPFSGDVDPVTGRYFINDVGEVTWEEINDATQPGHNFGWPIAEGMFDPGEFPDFTNPLLAYNHAADCAITGGAFNSFATSPLSPFPSQYDGLYFYSQFCAGQILVVDPDNPGDVQTFITDAAFPMNIEFGPDGSMYYIARGAGAGGAPGIGTGQVLKVQFAADVAPQIVQHPADRLVSAGHAATFTVSAAGTPVLTYQWQESDGGDFVDIPGATAATLEIPNASLADNGKQYRVVITNGVGSATSNPATLSVTADTPPDVQILLPQLGDVYRAGDMIEFSGQALDAEDGPLDASSMTWQIDFHHDEHSHPFLPPTNGIDGGQFTVPVNSETSANVWFRIRLQVTDSAGLTTEVIRDLHPVTSNFTVQTNAGDTNVFIDGQPKPTPQSITGVVNVNRSLEAPATVNVEGQSGVFLQWLDGETSRQRTIATPEDDTAYVAIYQTNTASGFVYASDLPWVSQQNGWGSAHRDISNGEQDDGESSGPITINGVEYQKGIGAHAHSEIVIELDGLYQRFISDIGLDDENSGGSVEFLVYGDNQLLFQSGVMNSGAPTQTVDVSVEGMLELRLVVTDGGNGNGNDHADWADARLTGPAIFLSDLPWQSATNGWGPVEIDRSNGEDDAGETSGPIEINDIIYPKGLGVHANSEIVYNLGGNYVRFLADVGIDDEVEEFPNDADGSVVFRVFADNVEVFTSTNMDGNDPTESVDIDVTGVQELRLVVDDLGSNGEDHAAWANAIVVPAVAQEEFIFPFQSADTTLDGKLSYADVLAFGAGWGAHDPGASLQQLVQAGDLNFDFVTDQSDWDIFYAAWSGAGQPPLEMNAVINPIPGDYDRNGAIDAADRALWRDTFGSTDELAADGNGDGVVNAADYVLWRNSEAAAMGAGHAAGAAVSASTTVDAPPAAAPSPAASFVPPITGHDSAVVQRSSPIATRSAITTDTAAFEGRQLLLDLLRDRPASFHQSVFDADQLDADDSSSAAADIAEGITADRPNCSPHETAFATF